MIAIELNKGKNDMHPDTNNLLTVTNGGTKKPSTLAHLSRCIMIVDNDTRPTETHPLCQPLTQCGYQINHVINSREALAQLKYNTHNPELATFRPSLIISDLFLNDSDGLDFVQELRVVQKLTNLHAPILLVATIESNPTFEQAVLNMGADDFIVKPVRPSDLLLRVRRLLRGLPGVLLEQIETSRLEKRCGRELEAHPLDDGNSPFRALRKHEFDFE